jgi:dipeptidyl aminopeptidase/acylaminoacyl peptidase
MDVNEGVSPDTDPGPMNTDLPQEKIERLTDYGSWMKKELDIHPLEEFWYKGADGDPVHGFLLKPPGFDRRKKYPLVLIIHGGPQSAFFDHFHYRWNPQMFAGAGYIVAELNPRGSIGYGQEFTDQISGDWGGRCYQDIMKGLDHVLDSYSFIDRERVSAAGASFGGFMVNWISGHTDRFKVLISHDGIFNQETMSYMTEELWFDRWEHGGYPHEDHESFLKYSPHMHVQNFKTPMLVIQGELDFRCPVSEGIALFTALQVMKVPSRFLYFPDEGHWVLKPANLEVWYDTVLDWIGRYI